MAAAETVRLYLDEHCRGVLRCATCGLQRPVQLPADPAFVISDRVTVTCRKCQTRFRVQFDVRRAPRIALHMLGLLYRPGVPTPWARVTVTSLSRYGLGFTTAQPLGLHPDARYEIVMLLNALDGSLIIDELTIRWCEGTQVGAEFYPPDQDHQVLEFYQKAAGLDP